MQILKNNKITRHKLSCFKNVLLLTPKFALLDFKSFAKTSSELRGLGNFVKIGLVFGVRVLENS